jgi:hypothetical protein
MKMNVQIFLVVACFVPMTSQAGLLGRVNSYYSKSNVESYKRNKAELTIVEDELAKEKAKSESDSSKNVDAARAKVVAAQKNWMKLRQC